MLLFWQTRAGSYMSLSPIPISDMHGSMMYTYMHMTSAVRRWVEYGLQVRECLPPVLNGRGPSGVDGQSPPPPPLRDYFTFYLKSNPPEKESTDWHGARHETTKLKQVTHIYENSPSCNVIICSFTMDNGMARTCGSILLYVRCSLDTIEP